MDVLGSAGLVLRNLSDVRQFEERDVRALAGGLRVQSAADDPSGLAISETMRSKIAGLQQGVQNVQEANNLLNVAESALESIQHVLSRVHALIVESRSDLNSGGQLQSIQDEISQLLLEVDNIGQSANFNGLHLLDGSFDTSGAQGPQVEQVTSEPNADGSLPSSQVADADGAGNPGALFQGAGTLGPGYAISGIVEIRVIKYSSDPGTVDPSSGMVVGPSDFVQVTSYSSDPNFGNGQQQTTTTAIPIDSGQVPAQLTSANGTYLMLSGTLANLSPQDVGTAMTFVTTTGKGAGTGSALSVNDGGSEGETVAISLPTANVQAMGIAGISVLAPAVVDGSDNPIGTSSSNTYAADDAEVRVRDAMMSMSGALAQIGAQSASLQADANDGSLANVNETAAESAIRDADIGRTVTDYTKNQILAQVGTSVLAQLQSDAKQVLSLVASSFAPSSAPAASPSG